MEAKAIQRYVRITPRKCNQVLGLIRGMNVESAQTTLQFTPKYGARIVQKVLKSAVANASQDENVDVNQLYVSEARADDGPLQQHRLRWRPGPQGRAMPVRKRTSHLTVIVAERAQ